MQRRLPMVVASLGIGLVTFVSGNPSSASGADSPASEIAKPEHWFHYTNEVNEDVPLSIHVVRVERARHDFEFGTTLGKGNAFGMAVVSEQVKALPPDCGQQLAAINGDFYEKNEKYLGRPRDLQIHFGEVISTPAGHT